MTEWDKDMEWAVSKYYRYPICEKCYTIFQKSKEKEILNTDYGWISDDYYRNDWEEDFCFFCWIVKTLSKEEAHPL